MLLMQSIHAVEGNVPMHMLLWPVVTCFDLLLWPVAEWLIFRFGRCRPMLVAAGRCCIFDVSWCTCCFNLAVSNECSCHNLHLRQQHFELMLFQSCCQSHCSIMQWLLWPDSFMQWLQLHAMIVVTWQLWWSIAMIGLDMPESLPESLPEAGKESLPESLPAFDMKCTCCFNLTCLLIWHKCFESEIGDVWYQSALKLSNANHMWQRHLTWSAHVVLIWHVF